jgi:hypothetical protein
MGDEAHACEWGKNCKGTCREWENQIFIMTNTVTNTTRLAHEATTLSRRAKFDSMCDQMMFEERRPHRLLKPSVACPVWLPFSLPL